MACNLHIGSCTLPQWTRKSSCT